MKFRFISALLTSFSTLVVPLSAAAADTPPHPGLSVTPVRQEVTAAAGKTVTKSFTVANQTDKVMTVDFSVKQFSASNFKYDFVFHPVENDWLQLGTTRVDLKPKESRNISYSFDVPVNAKPGGHYYMILASTHIADQGLPATVQAAVSLYLTVSGNLVRTGTIEHPTLPWLVMGSDIPYKFDARNTGNVHFSAYLYAQSQGLFGAQPATGTGHVLMPQTVRTIEGSLPSPVVPGIYKVTYGYKTDFGTSATNSSYIVFLPPWSIIATLLAILAGLWVIQKIRRSRTNKKQP